MTTIAVAVVILYLVFGVVTKATKWIFRIALAVIIFSLFMHGYDAVEEKLFASDLKDGVEDSVGSSLQVVAEARAYAGSADSGENDDVSVPESAQGSSAPGSAPEPEQPAHTASLDSAGGGK